VPPYFDFRFFVIKGLNSLVIVLISHYNEAQMWVHLVFFIPLVGGSTLRELAAGRVYMGAAISPNYFSEANYSDVSQTWL